MMRIEPTTSPLPAATVNSAYTTPIALSKAHRQNPREPHRCQRYKMGIYCAAEATYVGSNSRTFKGARHVR